MAEFLAPKNWEKRQPGRKGKSEWIKDYTDKDSDKDYEKLTFFQRYVLDGIRRLRGRLGKNVPNDPGYIARALHAGRKDTPHIPHAVLTLTARELLILTNQEFDFVDKDKEIDKEEEKEETKDLPEAPAKRQRKVRPTGPETSSGLKVVMLLPLNNGDEFPIQEEDFNFWKTSYPAVDVMQELRAMGAWCHANPNRRKTKTGVKAFVNRWLAKAQNNPKAAENFKGAMNGNGSTSKTGQRNTGNLQALISGTLGDSLCGNDVHHGGPVQPGVVRDAQGPTITIPNRETVEGKPKRTDPASDARRTEKLHGF